MLRPVDRTNTLPVWTARKRTGWRSGEDMEVLAPTSRTEQSEPWRSCLPPRQQSGISPTLEPECQPLHAGVGAAGDHARVGIAGDHL